jgi:hypothetical protein
VLYVSLFFQVCFLNNFLALKAIFVSQEPVPAHTPKKSPFDRNFWATTGFQNEEDQWGGEPL